MRVLVACEFSGIVREAFRVRGHDAWSCDLLPTEYPSPFHIIGDVRLHLDEGWDLMIAHPPCTRLSNSGARWLIRPPKRKTLEQMWDGLRKGAAFYRELRDAKGVPRRVIENPRMHCHAKKLIEPGPRQVVQPWYFGDPFFKETGFELIGVPPLKETNRLTPPLFGTEEYKQWSAVHRASPGKDRWKDRSRTYPGIAAAMAEQWGDVKDGFKT